MDPVTKSNELINTLNKITFNDTQMRNKLMEILTKVFTIYTNPSITDKKKDIDPLKNEIKELINKLSTSDNDFINLYYYFQYKENELKGYPQYPFFQSVSAILKAKTKDIPTISDNLKTILQPTFTQQFGQQPLVNPFASQPTFITQPFPFGQPFTQQPVVNPFGQPLVNPFGQPLVNPFAQQPTQPIQIQTTKTSKDILNQIKKEYDSQSNTFQDETKIIDTILNYDLPLKQEPKDELNSYDISNFFKDFDNWTQEKINALFKILNTIINTLDQNKNIPDIQQLNEIKNFFIKLRGKLIEMKNKKPQQKTPSVTFNLPSFMEKKYDDDDKKYTSSNIIQTQPSLPLPPPQPSLPQQQPQQQAIQQTNHYKAFEKTKKYIDYNKIDNPNVITIINSIYDEYPTITDEKVETQLSNFISLNNKEAWTELTKYFIWTHDFLSKKLLQIQDKQGLKDFKENFRKYQQYFLKLKDFSKKYAQIPDLKEYYNKNTNPYLQQDLLPPQQQQQQQLPLPPQQPLPLQQSLPLQQPLPPQQPLPLPPQQPLPQQPLPQQPLPQQPLPQQPLPLPPQQPVQQQLETSENKELFLYSDFIQKIITYIKSSGITDQEIISQLENVVDSLPPAPIDFNVNELNELKTNLGLLVNSLRTLFDKVSIDQKKALSIFLYWFIDLYTELQIKGLKSNVLSSYVDYFRKLNIEGFKPVLLSYGLFIYPDRPDKIKLAPAYVPTQQLSSVTQTLQQPIPQPIPPQQNAPFIQFKTKELPIDEGDIAFGEKKTYSNMNAKEVTLDVLNYILPWKYGEYIEKKIYKFLTTTVWFTKYFKQIEMLLDLLLKLHAKNLSLLTISDVYKDFDNLVVRLAKYLAELLQRNVYKSDIKDIIKSPDFNTYTFDNLLKKIDPLLDMFTSVYFSYNPTWDSYLTDLVLKMIKRINYFREEKEKLLQLQQRILPIIMKSKYEAAITTGTAIGILINQSALGINNKILNKINVTEVPNIEYDNDLIFYLKDFINNVDTNLYKDDSELIAQIINLKNLSRIRIDLQPIYKTIINELQNVYVKIPLYDSYKDFRTTVKDLYNRINNYLNIPDTDIENLDEIYAKKKESIKHISTIDIYKQSIKTIDKLFKIVKDNNIILSTTRGFSSDGLIDLYYTELNKKITEEENREKQMLEYKKISLQDFEKSLPNFLKNIPFCPQNIMDHFTNESFIKYCEKLLIPRINSKELKTPNVPYVQACIFNPSNSGINNVNANTFKIENISNNIFIVIDKKLGMQYYNDLVLYLLYLLNVNVIKPFPFTIEYFIISPDTCLMKLNMNNTFIYSAFSPEKNRYERETSQLIMKSLYQNLSYKYNFLIDKNNIQSKFSGNITSPNIKSFFDDFTYTIPECNTLTKEQDCKTSTNIMNMFSCNYENNKCSPIEYKEFPKNYISQENYIPKQLLFTEPKIINSYIVQNQPGIKKIIGKYFGYQYSDEKELKENELYSKSINKLGLDILSNDKMYISLDCKKFSEKYYDNFIYTMVNLVRKDITSLNKISKSNVYIKNELKFFKSYNPEDDLVVNPPVIYQLIEGNKDTLVELVTIFKDKYLFFNQNFGDNLVEMTENEVSHFFDYCGDKCENETDPIKCTNKKDLLKEPKCVYDSSIDPTLPENKDKVVCKPKPK